jgi:hypothetical protein
LQLGLELGLALPQLGERGGLLGDEARPGVRLPLGQLELLVLQFLSPGEQLAALRLQRVRLRLLLRGFVPSEPVLLLLLLLELLAPCIELSFPLVEPAPLLLEPPACGIGLALLVLGALELCLPEAAGLVRFVPGRLEIHGLRRRRRGPAASRYMSPLRSSWKSVTSEPTASCAGRRP